MKLIETTEIRDRYTGILFSYADRYMLEEEDLKDYPDRRLGECIEIRRMPDFKVRDFK